MKFNLLLISMIAFLSSCLKGDDRLKLENKSDRNIFYIWSEDTIIGPDVISASDTLEITSKGGDTYSSPNWRKVPIDSIKTIKQICCWEDAFKMDTDHTQHLFIFKEETIKNLPWDSIEKNNLYDKRIDLKIEDFESNNWKIEIQ